MDRFFHEVLDFYAVERVATSLDDDADYIASWLSTGMRPHDIALIDGPQGKLHHFAFGLKDWSEILHAGQLFTMDDVSVDIGPTQHGITRGETIYFFDPSGNRNEVFAGGYEAFPTARPSSGRRTSWARASSTSTASSTSGSPRSSPEPGPHPDRARAGRAVARRRSASRAQRRLFARQASLSCSEFACDFARQASLRRR